ncbi:NADH:ubiquinone ESSS subunit [Micractinium conductrix]|uniref:NADH:ubiquinone ESSS subunit n=1 Tax=Micractinium conductrix TaxID=554055 RepID=A0A2P6V5W1_9CHLO|nr:NADH:ubiquinone ESSS subunit [Micractinium conductrix]|eukprot:PSC69476.1 NADH:ubiquinone ESSS subunit [Micractinium conductrix]
MSLLLRRLPLTARRCSKTRGSGGGSFFAEGKHEPSGNLFGETPPPAGQSRTWESWEGPWYFTFGAATAMLVVGLQARPDSSLTAWADRQAAEKHA